MIRVENLVFKLHRAGLIETDRETMRLSIVNTIDDRPMLARVQFEVLVDEFTERAIYGS